MKSSFQYLNDYFDKIVVLTLPRLTDRIAYINKTLEGLNFEFFFGTDKEKHRLKNLKNRGFTALHYTGNSIKNPQRYPPECFAVRWVMSAFMNI
ncbi:MAG: hypothetical protein IPK57_14855 [Chitinophagaceae bacterium]|nr:hypothetical protein [Chitinophagaceae bacterium]